MRTFAAVLAVAALAAFAGATTASARATKLTPAESKWAAGVVKLLNGVNHGLQVVITQATATDALVVGSKNNRTLNSTLALFIECNKNLKKAGTPPPRLAKFAASMKSACTQVNSGAHQIAQGIAAYIKKQNALGKQLFTKGVTDFQGATKQLGTAYRRLLAVSNSK